MNDLPGIAVKRSKLFLPELEPARQSMLYLYGYLEEVSPNAADKCKYVLVELNGVSETVSRQFIRIAEEAGVDRELIDAAHTGAMKEPPMSRFAYKAVVDLRKDYDELLDSESS